MEDKKATIEKVGVMWTRKFRNGKEGFKISINKEIFIAFLNLRKSVVTDPDFIIVRFIDEPKINIKVENA